MSSGESHENAALILRARPEAVIELAQVRKRELEVLSERLARVSAKGRAKPWSAAAGALASIGTGALIAGVPLLSSTSDWDSWVIPLYAASVGVTLVLAVVCAMAARSTRHERADSVAAVKDDLDRLLDAYELPPPPSVDGGMKLDASDLVPLLGNVRREARTNRQLLDQVIERRRFWNITENTPALKAWKRDRFLLEGVPELERVLEAGEAAQREIDRVLMVRSLRLLRGGKNVKPSDRLTDARDAVSNLEEVLLSLGSGSTTSTEAPSDSPG